MFPIGSFSRLGFRVVIVECCVRTSFAVGERLEVVVVFCTSNALLQEDFFGGRNRNCNVVFLIRPATL